jgi:class 3 adenylate cyclase/Tol biopolymer transport system component
MMPDDDPLRPASATGEPRTRGYLFCDLRGYTAFIEAHGDQAGAALLERYRSIVRAAVARSAGAEIRTEGDSFYVVFPSASRAVSCGLDILVGAHDEADRSRDLPIEVGVGIHAGEAVEQAEGYVGSAVNIAARVCAEARAGEVLVTDTVRGLVRTSLDVTFTTRGSRRLKGIAEPIALYRVTRGSLARVKPGVRVVDRSWFRGLLLVGSVLLVVGAAVIARPWASVGSSSPSPSGTPPASVEPSVPASAGASGTAALPGRLAFIASQVVGAGTDPRWQLYVVDAAGGDWRRMTELTDQVQLATWSPDGRQLLYSLQGDENVPPRIVTVEEAPAWTQRPWPSATDIIEWQDRSYSLVSVDWSPTGEAVVEGNDAGYPGVDDGRSRIFAVPADGSTVRLVTEPEAPRTMFDDQLPTVSPDGATIVFYSGSSPTSTRVWAAGADGTGRIQVNEAVLPYFNTTTAGATGASWSPDGSRLVIAGRAKILESSDIWTMNAQGTELRRLNDDRETDDRPAWSPDGRWITWTRTVSYQRQIWVMAADGSDRRPLIVGAEGEDLDLVGWAPTP